MTLWSQGPLQSSIQIVKNEFFGGIWGDFWIFMYEMSQRSFDLSPPLSTSVWLKENKNNNEKNKNLSTILVPVDVNFMCIMMCLK
jgi:hypothetical protein